MGVYIPDMEMPTRCGRCDMCVTEADGDIGDAPQVMTVVDETADYTIYKHDQTGVWYFCRERGYGKSVCVMVNADGTPYTGG